MWGFTSIKYPKFWHDYEQSFRDKSTYFIVLDTETTGLEVKKDQILSIGAVKIVNQEILLQETKEWFLPTNFELNDSVPVHGILPTEENTTAEIQILEEFLGFISNATLIGHHIDFDLQIINQLLKNNNLKNLKNKHIDTSEMYKKWKHWPLEQNISLDDLLHQLQIQPIGRHTALGDAFTTALAFLKLKKLV
ncbi:MAG: 3'-5' exoribonuclease [Flavobacteriales bacterium]|nr:3'-5' exoribonuclease [Flavobacteriales bacterium]